MEVAEIMTRRVITVPQDARVEQAVQLMLDNRISGLPVCAPDGTVTGIVTESDLLRRTETGTERHRPRWLEFIIGPGKLAEEFSRSHARVVDEVMTRELISVGPRDTLERVVELMERKRVHRIPVLDKGRLVGMVTRANLMQALLSVASGAQPGPAGDEQIRDKLWAELDRQSWATPGMVNVLVRDGVVTLSGGVPDPRQIDALRVLAENIPGVRAVQDHMVWIDYMSGVVVDMSGEPTAPRPVPR